jgi:glutathione S-transferase
MKAFIHPASPNSVAVLALARELGFELQTETVDLFARENEQPDFLAVNPNGFVPVVDDGGFVLWETTAILQYLAAKRASEGWLAQDERGRADVTRWQVWSVAHWQPALQSFIFQNLFKRLRGLGGPDPQVLAEAAPRLVKNASILDVALRDQAWVCGDRATVADLTAAAYLVYAEPAAIPLGNYPHLLAWWSRLRRRPAWIAAEAGIPKFAS